ncbi:vitamin K epoxide reductase family protein [Kamptonema cortianum]|uniref:Vitamin K epoxide reductase family protein n=1 Tax=Geitlerinema calcuttense NRMC-F 0142 TaxID=2922238 RepID=A0ABT7LWL4_9CYAN|nr:vitamin K epoxide reductase family protein [Geitlerinema calcuttense]MCD8486869.1 vitamin K epoxide reductase family protein [Desertifilum sp.]MDK3159017.1 vitamin K epoxide reductase family protein [Kamptonema cortianum]MDL5056410.1 vitamin K epoxide reductase family protein [Geitlerinema calcuttense NRMC-F 0142]
MRRRRSTPWIHRWSRPALAAIATLGALETAFLTVAELTGNASAVCPTTGCELVLTSPYAMVMGIPLTLFGFLGYLTMGLLAIAPLLVNAETQKERRSQLEKSTWFLLFIGATAMLVGSAYLMYIMAAVVQAFCPYCVASAIFSLALFVLTIVGHAWEDVGQLLFTGIIVGMVVLLGALGLYANVNQPPVAQQQDARTPPPVTTVSGEAEIALARHLSEIGAREFGAYWCPHCHDQKELFGREAAQLINYVECAADGQNSQMELCRSQGITGFPTWEIRGQMYPGVQSLESLAQLSGYQGPRNFLR